MVPNIYQMKYPIEINTVQRLQVYAIILFVEYEAFLAYRKKNQIRFSSSYKIASSQFFFKVDVKLLFFE